ncbi:sodium- and chloride-dependent glycine transporter 2-like [Haemaphysalis longicornis]
MSVGLGNVWRFPYVVFENGGGAFMVPYMILMLVVGRPMYYLELIMGQFASSAQARSFGGFPLAVGVGWAMVYACAFISLYYNVILGYALLYLAYSFSNRLPWQSCDYSSWADENCYNPLPGVVQCGSVEGNLWKRYVDSNYTGPESHVLRRGDEAVLVPLGEFVKLTNSCTNATQTAPEQFFYRNVLNLSSGIEELGSVQAPLSVALVVSWMLVFLSVFRGIKTSGKVVYVTALVPFLILGGMFLRGITLPGAGDGIRFYLVPKWSSIMQTKVWKNAAEQIFYSLSIAEGMIICFGGFNEFRNRLHVDVLVVALADFVVSVLGGVVVFSVLGNMAHNLGVPVHEVVSSGIGLAFIAYPQALTMIAYPQAWAVVFYAMLFFLAIDTEFASVECLLTPFKDEYPWLRAHGTLLSFIVCALMCVCGMPMACRGGLYILTLMDTYLGGYLLPWIGLAELLVVLLGYVHHSIKSLADP